MADPYALLAANDERFTAGFESINRNAIATFNAESEAAKFGFQAHMQVAQLEEQRLNGIAERDNTTRRLNLEEKRINQSMSLAKLAGARQLAEADREFNYRIAGEARQNLDSQLEALGTEESQWQSASLAGDPSAGDKIKEIQSKKTEIRSQMGDVYNKLKTEMDAGNTLNMGKEIQDLDAILEGRPIERTPPPDDMLESLGDLENPIGSEEMRDLDAGVLPSKPGTGPNNLTGSAPRTTEPVANSLITQATRQNTEVARDFFPAALNEATRKATVHYKDWLNANKWLGQKEDQTRIPTEIGNVLAKDPSGTPDGGLVELNPKQANHFKSLIKTDYASVPEGMRPSLLQGKRRAYSSLLQAGDPEVRRQYDVLFNLGTIADVTDTQADAQLQDAVKEGMIDDHTRRSWLLQKQGNIAAKGKTADPNADPMKQVSSALELLAKARELEKTGSLDNPQNPIALGEDFKTGLVESARSTLAHFQLDMGAKELMNRIDYAKQNGGSPDMISALQTELAEKNFAKGRLYASERLPQLNETLRSRGVLGPSESAIALAKQGQANFIKVISDRMRTTGMSEADAKASANVLYTQYATAAPFISGETDPTTGQVLSAPKSIQIQVGPSAAAANGVVDNTFMGGIREFFSDADKAITSLSQSKRAAEAVSGLGVTEMGVTPEVSKLYSQIGSAGTQALPNLARGIRQWGPDNFFGSDQLSGVFSSTKATATKIADAETERVFSKGQPNQKEVDSLRNDIETLGIYGRFNLNDRTDYHNALKRVIGVKLVRGSSNRNQ